MTDNTTLPPGGGGDTVRDIDRAGIKTQVVQLDIGGAAAESLVTGAMPVSGTFWQATQPVSGTVAASQSGAWSVTVGAALPAGANVIGAVTQSGTWNIGSITTLPALAAGAATIGAVNLAQYTPVTGRLPVDGSGVTQPVSLASTTITGTVAVSGPLTDTQLRAAAVPVSQSGTWNIGSITTLPALATGANVIGAVTQSGTWNIGSITTLPALVAGAALIGKVGIDQTTPGTTNAVSITNASLAITAASLPLPTGAALDATLTGGTARTKITDGTNNVGIAGGVTAASEVLTDRLKVNAEILLLDTSQVSGSQLVAGRGDQTGGLWVNNKNPDQAELLGAILNELRTIAALLQSGLSVTDDLTLLRNDVALTIN